MSLLDRLFGGLFEDDEEEQVVEHPCSNCPGTCTIAPAACSVCQPYKERLIEAIYRVEHKDEILSQYEVAAPGTFEGSVICPNCGGHSQNQYVCDYCGSKLKEGTGKIIVESALDIPNPVLEAQDIIFSRYDAVKGYAGADSGYGYEDALSGIGSQGLFSSIFSALMGDDSAQETKSIGQKMTEAEIEEMAKYYDVSVAQYLTGLDNGKYLTLSSKSAAAEAEKTYTKQYTSTQQGSSVGDIAGLAGAMGLGSLLFGGSTYNRSMARDPYQNRRVQQNPYQQPQNKNADPRLKNAAKGPSVSAQDVRRAQEAKKIEEAKRAQEAQRIKQAQEAQRAKQAQEAKKASASKRSSQDQRLNSNLSGRAPSAAQIRQARNAQANAKLDTGKLNSSGRAKAASAKSDRGAAPGRMKGRP